MNHKLIRAIGIATTVLLFLAIAGAIGFAGVGNAHADDSNVTASVVDAQALRNQKAWGADLPKVPSDQDGMFVEVEKTGVVVGKMDGAEVTRFDDWERGVSCYRMYTFISCASMAEKVYELRQTGMRF